MSINNTVLLIGYVGKDLQLQQLESGSKKVVIRMATHDSYKDETGSEVQSTTWHDVVAWDEMASLATNSFVKGSHIRVNGRIRYRTYADQNGHTRYVTEIKAEYLQNLDR